MNHVEDMKLKQKNALREIYEVGLNADDMADLNSIVKRTKERQK